MEASHAVDRGGREGLARSPPPSRNGMDNIQTSALNVTAKRSSRSRPMFASITWILILFCSAFFSYRIGVWTGSLAAPDRSETKPNMSKGKSNAFSEEQLRRRIEALAKEQAEAILDDLRKSLNTSLEGASQTSRGGALGINCGFSAPKAKGRRKGVSNLFSKSISHFAKGLVRVKKGDLMTAFDFGVPQSPNTEGLEALILYNKERALPSDERVVREARFEDPTRPLPLLPAANATENCDTMNVLLMNNPGNTRQCFALVGGQYQSYHVQRWMRRATWGGLDPRLPLRLTSRGRTASGKVEFPPPEKWTSQQHQKRLVTYLTEADGIRSRLKETLEKMNAGTVVVLTCNHGQSELLMNFVCSARARGFDLKNVLLFPTDLETKELAEGVGLTAFYEEKMMASMPKKEARSYGDNTFKSLMFAKVLCVQLVNELGHDVLFQDVDVVWFKDPLSYFRDGSLPEFDVYFQDDGSRQERYAPYSANTGFYYVRSNERTRHLFRHLLYAGDLISEWKSHQQVLVAFLAEHSSTFGLSVKIFAKETEEFPGGVHYHNQKAAMKRIMRGETNAFIFHMSWTLNKVHKVMFFQQMGEWYLKGKCVGKQAWKISVDEGEMTGAGALTKYCCSAEPLITCHFRDKPSKVPCPDSPTIDKNGKSFW